MSWEGFARIAGVPDVQAFQRCVDAQATRGTVEADIRLAAVLDLPGTPVVIHGARRFLGTTSIGGLLRTIDERHHRGAREPQ
jgi:hypothetical protein